MTGGKDGRVVRAERLVLCLDGSTRVSSAALLRHRPGTAGGSWRMGPWEIVERRAFVDTRGQARVLLQLTDEMLEAGGFSPHDLSALVVGVGPGTFTGVRVAVATARAMALALAIPVIGLSTLSALAAGVAHRLKQESLQLGLRPERLTVAIDARRGQLFCASYERRGAGWVRAADILLCDRNQLGTLITAPALVAAEDRSLLGDLPEGVTFLTAVVAAEHLVVGQELLQEPEPMAPGGLPSSDQGRLEGARLGSWLLRAVEQDTSLAAARPGELGTPESVKPIYVRSPDADIHITKMRDPWAAARNGCLSEGKPA